MRKLIQCCNQEETLASLGTQSHDVVMWHSVFPSRKLKHWSLSFSDWKVCKAIIFFIPVNCPYLSRYVHKGTNYLTVQNTGRNTEVKCLFRMERWIIRAAVVQSKHDQSFWCSFISWSKLAGVTAALFKDTAPPFHHVTQKDAGHPKYISGWETSGGFNQSIYLFFLCFIIVWCSDKTCH